MNALDQTKQSNSFMAQVGPLLKQASQDLVNLDEGNINKALHDLADMILIHKDDILEANKKDISLAQKAGQTKAYLDRLALTIDRISAIAQSVKDIAALPDPVGHCLEEWTRPNGLHIRKMSVPIGVLGIIFESRPNVTIDAAALCLKSHNACLLRPGSDSFQSAQALHALIQKALKRNKINANAVRLVESTDRAIVGEMLAAHNYIDVIIPRGGKSLTGRVMRDATMPVFAHLDGNCHIYVAKDANPVMARDVIINAKLRRTGICGALESLLLDHDLAPETAAIILSSLIDQGCTVKGDDSVKRFDDRIQQATEEDWSKEYLDTIVSCKSVYGVQDAIDHINTYGSHHTDCIITEDYDVAALFQKKVDSAIVLHNASTQFADGGEFGMGAEIGIGTGKLHARGPVGVRQLTTFKYLVNGTGQRRP